MFTVMYKPGKVNLFADYTLRNPASSEDPAHEAGGLSHTTGEDVQDQDLIASIATVIRKQLPITKKGPST